MSVNLYQRKDQFASILMQGKKKNEKIARKFSIKL